MMSRILRRFSVTIYIFAIALFSLTPAKAGATITPKMNGKILYSQANSGWAIWTKNADGTDNTRLTNSAGSIIDTEPSWSPDGTKIVFQSDRISSSNREIYIMNSDGTNPVRLTNNSDHDEEPRWSPDGTKIAFLSDRTGDYDVFIMDADGSNQTNISNNVAMENNPVWSPDGTKVAYESDRSGRAQIYTYTLSNTTTTQITSNSGSDQRSPAFSPDGTKMLMASTKAGGALQAYTMNTDGTNQQLVSTCPNTAVTFPIFANYPIFSPDGKYVLASSNCYTEALTNNAGFVLYNLSGGDPVDYSSDPSHSYWAYKEWRGVPVSSSTTDGDTTTNIVDNDESDEDYDVGNSHDSHHKVVLVVNGKVGQVNVNSNGVLKGNGTIVLAVTVKQNGKIAPGQSPGCLNTGDLNLANGAIFEEEIAGTTVCSEYDQVNVAGTVTLTNPTLNTLMLNGFAGKIGNSFTIINNDSSDAVSGTFNGLPEGATINTNGTVFKVSYVGGDGNDVTLTIQSVPATPNTGMTLLTANPALVFGVTILSSGGLLYIAKRYGHLARR